MLVRFYVGLERAYGDYRNLENVTRLGSRAQDHADELFGGSTVYRAVGSWHSVREAAAVFEVVWSPYGPDEQGWKERAPVFAQAISGARTQEWRKITLFARWLRRAFGQKKVLVVKLASTTESI